jgi:hypothetical protein
MKKSAHWAPAPNLTILTFERDETNWAVSLSGGDHAICPNGQDAIACRSVIETREIGEKFVQDVGGLLKGKLAPKLHLQMPQFGRGAMRKENGHGRRGGGTSANASLEARRMNAQMPKHRVDPPPPNVRTLHRSNVGKTAAQSALGRSSLSPPT